MGNKEAFALTLFLIGCVVVIIGFTNMDKHNPTLVTVIEIRDTADLIDGEIKYKAKVKYLELKTVEILYLPEHYKVNDTINLLTNKNK